MSAYLFTQISNNKKTGKIPVTSSGRHDCAPDCPLFESGCYALYSHLGVLWNNLTKTIAGKSFKHGRNAIPTVSWAGLCEKVAALPSGQLWRHNQMGDLPHNQGRIAKRELNALVKANKGKRGFTYTHHNVLQSKHNRQAVESANKAGFTVNLSGNNLAHADLLAKLNIAPVVTILPGSFQGTKTTKTPAGRLVVICPAINSDTITCKSCELCQKNRPAIVGFPVHGAGRMAAEKV